MCLKSEWTTEIGDRYQRHLLLATVREAYEVWEYILCSLLSAYCLFLHSRLSVIVESINEHMNA